MKVSSFFDYQGPGRISIARYAPRGTPAGFRVYKPLAPGPWFNSVSRTEYERRYAIQLGHLNTLVIWNELHSLAGDTEPVLLCWEHKHDIFVTRKTWCHRHLVADWFQQTLGQTVEEL